MKHILKYSIACSFFAIIITMISCNDDNTSSDLYSAIYPKSVEMIIPEEIQQLIYLDDKGVKVLPLIKGESVKFGHTISPENVTFKDISWFSSNTGVVTVNNDGVITAVSGDGTGYSIVQVSPDVLYAGSSIFSTLKIIVSNTLIPATSITLSSQSDEVFAGETLQLSASILPENATYKTLKWTSSDENIATVDMNGLVKGKENSEISAEVTISATSLDGAEIIGTKQLIVKQIVQPLNVTIDQTYSVGNGYLNAISDKTLTLSYTTDPLISTSSLIEWASDNESIATVKGGVVTFNQNGVFGDVTITATCPETGNNSSIILRLEEGLVRELFHDQNNYNWYDAQQSANGTSTSHVLSYGKVTVKTYTQTVGTKQRADFKCWSPKTWIHAGKYPIIAIRIQDVKDLYSGVTARNIVLDASGTCNGTTYSGKLGKADNAWLNDYKCSDGTHVFIYDLTQQEWATGGKISTEALATFTTLQFKYADIATLSQQVTYDVHWIQTFKTKADVQAYIASEGLTYEIIK